MEHFIFSSNLDSATNSKLGDLNY